MSDLLIIGSEEWCEFSLLGIPAIKARVDSGARTSAMHAFNISPFTKDGDNEWISFDIHPLQNNKKLVRHCEAKIVDVRPVKNSSGIVEKRYVIKTKLTLNGRSWDIEMTLANRDAMGFKLLLGREAMNGRILVDPSQVCILGEVSKEELQEHYQSYDKPTTGLKIGLLASNPELLSNRRIMEEGEQHGHEMVFLDVQQCYMKLDTKKPEIRYRGSSILNDLDAVIPRIRPSLTFYGCALVRQFESLGVYCLNESSAISQSRDKLFSSQLFSKNGIDIPTTGFAKSTQETKDLINMVNGAPLIIKLLEGTQGMGVVLAETTKAAESVINAFKSVKANILVQEFIKEANGKDIRCFVIDGKVVASIQRVAAKGEFRANLHMGGTASEIKITSEEKKLAIKAAKVLNLQVAGVDIIRSNKGPLLLEVNSSPGLEGIENATGINVAGRMIQAIERCLLN